MNYKLEFSSRDILNIPTPITKNMIDWVRDNKSYISNLIDQLREQVRPMGKANMLLLKSLGFSKGCSALVSARIFLEAPVNETLAEEVEEPDVG
jgi:hypothetical protein